MIEGLEDLLVGSGQPGLAELRSVLQELLGEATGRLLDEHNLKTHAKRVYRLCLALNGNTRSLVVKCLEPSVAWRNQLVMTRWLPAIGLRANGPTLLGTAAERNGQCVWHVYEDFGDWTLDASKADPERVQVAVELIAQVHTRFVRHPLLAECRMYGGDLGMYCYAANVRDAIYGLEALRPPAVELSPERLALRDRLLQRMYKLLDEQTARAQALAELGGPETLLHGDLWTINTFVLPSVHGWHARLIDWDHVAVGPASYDLSTFLLRFAAQHRPWILQLYREAMGQSGWRLPSATDLNLLFETAEYARFANCIIWPALALVKDHAAWGFDALAEVEWWFEKWRPVLPEKNEAHA
jgi:hypothetical protein